MFSRDGIKIWIVGVVVLLSTMGVEAQHTVGVSTGYTMGSIRPYPVIETGSVSGFTGGVSWRYYSQQRYVGAVGVDLEFIQRGYTILQNSAAVTDGLADPLNYTRNINSIIVPIVWQPHFYAFNNTLRVFLDAAATFSYNMSSTYSNEAIHEYYPNEQWEGTYEFKTCRDNRFGYGLMGGLGVAVLVGPQRRYEIMGRVRYYFGYSDIVRNLDEYRDNGTDGAENPFSSTPLRSPLDNISISIGVNYRMGKSSGFDSLEAKVEPKVKMGRRFNETIIGSKDKGTATKEPKVKELSEKQKARELKRQQREAARVEKQAAEKIEVEKKEVETEIKNKEEN